MEFSDFPYIGNSNPSDELHHFSEGLVETTKQFLSLVISVLLRCFCIQALPLS